MLVGLWVQLGCRVNSHKQNLRRFAVGIVLGSILFFSPNALSGPSSNQTADPSNNLAIDHLVPFLAEQRALLADYGLVPIIVPHGQQVGDLFRADSWLLVARAEDCFPGLSANVRRSPGALPTVSGHSARGLSAALGISSVAEVSLGAIGEHNWELSFADVEITSASVLQLRALLRTDEPECAAIKPALEASLMPGGAPVVVPPQSLVIGTLYEAKRVLRISLSDEKTAQAELSVFDDLLHKFGLTASTKIGGGGSSSGASTISITGDRPVPVAFGPAFVIRLPDPSLSYESPPLATSEEFDRNDPEHREDLMRLLKFPAN